MTAQDNQVEARLLNLEQAIDSIRERNIRVESDKAWETSSARIILICAITYVVAAAVLWLIGSERYWLNALLPTIGFYLSQQSLTFAKQRWIEKYNSELDTIGTKH